MLATVYLSEHRFGEAVREGERLRTQSPRDPWNYGVIGDGHLELGDYEDAFAAFQQMLDLRPSASAYARASYAYELRGQLSAALDAMRMAADATSPRDPESLAWHHAQIGNLLFQMGRAKEAEGEYARALAFWPGHPAAVIGLARSKAFAGDYAGALALFDEEFRACANARSVGDRLAMSTRRLEIEPVRNATTRSPKPAGAATRPNPGTWRASWPIAVDRWTQAVTIAEQAARERHDIFTEDALAWADFRAGRLAQASAASTLSLRTGTCDRTLLYHAAAIRHAIGDVAEARRLVARSLDGNPRFDLVSAPAARALRHALETHAARRPAEGEATGIGSDGL